MLGLIGDRIKSCPSTCLTAGLTPHDAVVLLKARDTAETLAFDVSSLLDGTETDELAEILVPVRDFLKNLAGL